MKWRHTIKMTLTVFWIVSCCISCEKTEDIVIPTVNEPRAIVEAPSAIQSYTTDSSKRDLDDLKKALDQAKFKTKNVIKISTKKMVSFSQEKLQQDIKTMSIEDLSGMSKEKWREIHNKSGYITQNKSIKSVPYEDLRNLFSIRTYPTGYVTISSLLCTNVILKRDYFAVFESKFQYFILSYSMDEDSRSSYPQWYVCRKKDNVEVFSLWGATYAMEPPKDGIATGLGCGMNGPEGGASFTRQKGNIPALIFQAVRCRDSGNDRLHTVLFDSRGVSKVIQHPKKKMKMKRSR